MKEEKRRSPDFIFLLGLTVLVVSLLAGAALVDTQAAFAQGDSPVEPTDDEVNAIAKQLYCPVCENIPLDVCPTQACAQWRELIREKLVEGWDEEQIKDYFVEQYGERVLGEPPARGLNWLVYLVPPFAFLTGGYILFRAMQNMRRQSPSQAAGRASTSSPQAPEDEYVKRLEAELREKN